MGNSGEVESVERASPRVIVMDYREYLQIISSELQRVAQPTSVNKSIYPAGLFGETLSVSCLVEI